ncbi:hypothetical protein ACJZ2D_013519 [Fusarium nematophilum]
MASWRRGGLQNHRRLGQRNGLDKESDNSHKKSCVYFRKGNCTYGSKCKFSHDTADAAGGSRPCPPDPDPDPEARERYYEWKSLIRRDRSRFHAFHTGNTSVQDALELWDGALAILDGDGKEHHQFLARDLVDDDFNGQRYITDTCKTALSAEMSVRCVESFLKVATHPALLDCLSIDTYVGTLYAMFGGPNGERGIDLLNRMCGKGLVKLGLFEESPGSDSLGVVDVTLKALYELLNRVPRAQFCDSLPALLESLEDVLGRLARDNSGAKLDALKSRLGIVKRVVSGAAGRIATEPSPEDGDAEQQTLSSFPRDVETPGGRHDNDFADISGISILPTYGEIMSDKPEYLPTTNFHHPHVLADPMQRHIDSMFRLVRHDTFDPINAVLSDVLASEDLSKARLSNRDSQAQIYSPANIRRISIDRRHGIEAIVSFINPPHIRKKTPSEQRSWWQASSRLDEGTLVCFVSMQDLLFLQVTAKNTEASEKPDPSKSTLVSSDFPPSITVKLANSPLRRSDLSLLVQLLSGKVSGVLVDFHGVIPDTFVPILKNLQKIKRENHIAFQTWILPGSSRAGSIPPPLYARKAGFFFPLGCISKNASSNLRLDPSEPPVDLKELERETGLDHGQCQGLIAALTREYALIQGPPGTGKSYLGVQLVRVLLAIKRQAKLGPILVICYTNHALDQFLKHLLGVGISKIIRIGGRSVTPELSGKNLRVVSRETLKTRLEGQILGQAYGELEKSMNMAGDAMRPLLHARKGPSWAGLQQFLARKHHEIYRQLKLEHDDGYKTVSKDPLVAWLGQRPPNTAGLPREGGLRRLARQAQEDMESLTNAERWTLVDSWLEQQHESQVDIVFESLDESEHQRRIINRTHEAVDQRTVIQADVVGITTTSLARNIVMLRRVKPKVVICEEAAEVQEAHIISALMPGVEHLIQIGDHRQLRPQINSFSLSLESSSGKMWQLDRSQFERRAVGEPGLRPAPFAQLDVQRRMRPDISRLIRRVYPHLQDHDSVVDLPDVVGMQRNLFWLDHNHVEDSGGDGNIKSHSNIWETNMATALVRHLVRQGEYKTEDIALLTPYTGQLQQLRAALSKDFEICLSDRDMEKLAHEGFEDVPADDGAQKNAVVEKKQLLQTIRLATVDNFQGEEAKVIVVSLVRSNTQRKVGFLRTENRINVLLSRAQHGMYLIGNSETYLNVPMWEDVHAQLAQAGSVGTEIELCCPRHPDTPLPCAEPDDFAIKSPEGGCILPCCAGRSAALAESKSMMWLFPAVMPRSLSSATRRWTWRQSGVPPRFKRRFRAADTLSRWNVAGMSLPRRYAVVNPVQRYSPADTSVVGAAACVGKLRVERFSSSTSCVRRSVIVPMVLVITAALRGVMMVLLVGVARHHARFNAHTPSAPRHATRLALRVSKSAPGPVLTRGHARCPAQHHAIVSPAMRDATRYSVAATDECSDKGDARVDLLEFRSYAEVDLHKSPIVVLGCGHFFTGETLDGLVGLDEVYTRGKDGAFDGLKNVSSSLARNVPFCPDCKRPIRQFASKRYNRLINRAVMDEICKRFIIKGREDLTRVERFLQGLADDLDKSRPSAAGSGLITFAERYDKVKKLENIAKALRKRLGEEHQPVRMLVDAIAVSRVQAAGDTLSITRQMEALKLAAPAPDKQLVLRAQLVVFKAREVQLRDGFAVAKIWKGTPLGDLVKAWSTNSALPSKGTFLRDSEELVKQAREANLPRIAIAATLAFAGVAWLIACHGKSVSTEAGSASLSEEKNIENVADRTEDALAMLNNALPLCSKLGNSDELRESLEGMIRLFEPRYEDVTAEELASIKSAMVSGSGGIATHSGHWYNCVNGHPFAIGECGMPMEVARCPECGAPIGGTQHQALEGVSRAEDMERA